MHAWCAFFGSMEDLDQDVLRRILFAVKYLPSDCPSYWDAIAKFASLGSSVVSARDVQLHAENLQSLNERAFATDSSLQQELHAMSHGRAQPLGIVLVSHQDKCIKCGGKLLLRSDRPSHVTVYTESLGTVPGSHYVKFCQNYRKGCNYNQHYGYYTMGNKCTTYYSTDWDKLPYFMSTSQTAFELKLLERFDFEL
jgi:hypothetical protein